MVEFLDFFTKTEISRKLTKVNKNYMKQRIASIKIKIMLNWAKCLHDKLLLVEQKSAKILKLRLNFIDEYSLHRGCFQKSKYTKMKVYLNHLKFDTGCFCDI